MRKDAVGGFRQVTVMALDDDPIIRATVGGVLRTVGCPNVIEVGNGPEALDILASRPVDLVLCDCRMRPMDGLTFLSHLRATPTGARMPVIMLTASEEEKDARLARELKARAWLAKPIDPATLVAEVASALGIEAPGSEPDPLATLAVAYEKRLPDEMEALAGLARALRGQGIAQEQALADLLHGLHRVRGQAGTLGYPLLGRVAGWLHDLLRRLERHPEATSHFLPDILRLVQVGAGALMLIAMHRLRGEGGEVGARIVTELGGAVSALSRSLDVAIQADAGAPRTPTPIGAVHDQRDHPSQQPCIALALPRS